MAGFKILQVTRFKRRKSFSELPRVIIANAKHNSCSAIHHGARGLRVALQLPQLLMRECHSQPIFPRSADDLRRARRQEIVALVEVEPKVAPCGNLLRLAAHRGLLELGHEKRS